MLFLPRKIAARPAGPDDRNAVLALTRYEERVHLHLDWKPVEDWLGSQPFMLAERGSKLAGALACPADRPDTAWVRLLAIGEGFSETEVWNVLWPPARDVLIKQHIPSIAGLSLDEWTTRLYGAAGWKHTHDVVVLSRKLDVLAPTQPLMANVNLRLAQPPDYDAIVKTDIAAFKSPWQLSEGMVRQAIVQAENLTVAEAEGQIIGYQLTTPSRVGAHLARLAVLPEWQGRGIGRALVTRLIRDCQQRRRGELTVNTQNTNATSLAVYQRLGFRLNGVRFPVYQSTLI